MGSLCNTFALTVHTCLQIFVNSHFLLMTILTFAFGAGALILFFLVLLFSLNCIYQLLWLELVKVGDAGEGLFKHWAVTNDCIVT